MLSLKGCKEIDQSDKAKPKPLENNLCEDMKDECLRNFSVGSQRMQEAGKEEAAKVDRRQMLDLDDVPRALGSAG